MRDIASAESEAEAADVRRVLDELGAGEEAGQRVLEVWNKIDLLPDEVRAFLTARAARERGGAVAVSAVTGEGAKRLIQTLSGLVDEGPVVTIELTAADGEGLAWLYRHGRVLGREDGEGGAVTIRARLDLAALSRFERLRPQAVTAAAAE